MTEQMATDVVLAALARAPEEQHRDLLRDLMTHSCAALALRFGTDAAAAAAYRLADSMASLGMPARLNRLPAKE